MSESKNSKPRRQGTDKADPPKKVHKYPLEFKLRAVKLHLDEKYTIDWIARELNITYYSVSSWVQKYRKFGEAGLQASPPPQARPKSQIGAEARAKAIELKKENPERGIRRISHLLRRLFFLKASPAPPTSP